MAKSRKVYLILALAIAIAAALAFWLIANERADEDATPLTSEERMSVLEKVASATKEEYLNVPSSAERLRLLETLTSQSR